jgi:hypothetical protein
MGIALVLSLAIYLQLYTRNLSTLTNVFYLGGVLAGVNLLVLAVYVGWQPPALRQALSVPEGPALPLPKRLAAALALFLAWVTTALTLVATAYVFQQTNPQWYHLIGVQHFLEAVLAGTVALLIVIILVSRVRQNLFVFGLIAGGAFVAFTLVRRGLTYDTGLGVAAGLAVAAALWCLLIASSRLGFGAYAGPLLTVAVVAAAYVAYLPSRREDVLALLEESWWVGLLIAGLFVAVGLLLAWIDRHNNLREDSP